MSAAFDVIVVGSGPGGAATAYFLAQQGVHVLLVDRSDFPRDKTCGDGLPPRAVAVLREMQLLEPLHKLGYRASEFHIVAPDGSSAFAAIPASDDLPSYTMVVPRYKLDDLIRRRALESGAVFLSPFNVSSIISSEQSVAVVGEHGGRELRLSARLAVLATGANMGLLKRLGLLRKPPLAMVAARAYFEDLAGLDGRVQFRFDGLPLPSYGWVFPLSPTAANIGAGFLPGTRLRRAGLVNARDAFERFTASQPLQTLLAGARRQGPIKGFPLRVDFAHAQTYADRLLLVGEAAGLVNPLTGDGVDYAVESAKLAAAHIVQMLAQDDCGLSRMSRYDQALRRQFQPLFMLCERLRWLLSSPLLLNRAIHIAGSDRAFQTEIMALVLRTRQPSAWMVLRLLKRLAFAR